MPFAFPSSPDTGPGLTEAGFRLVRQCNRLGIVVDVSHITEAGFWDIAGVTDQPIVASHSNARALAEHPRDLTDDQLRAIVKELGDKVNIEMSGGVRDDASLDAALEAGAARVNIGTAALENPDWTASVIKKYGDRVAVGLDVRGHTLAARGWVKEGGDLFETMKFLDSVGCSRYVVTDVARDGMMSGPNIELLREVASRTDAKVTASGGISKLDDLRNIKELAELGVDAAILGKSLYARAFTLEEALEVAR